MYRLWHLFWSLWGLLPSLALTMPEGKIQNSKQNPRTPVTQNIPAPYCWVLGPHSSATSGYLPGKRITSLTSQAYQQSPVKASVCRTSFLSRTLFHQPKFAEPLHDRETGCRICIYISAYTDTFMYACAESKLRIHTRIHV